MPKMSDHEEYLDSTMVDEGDIVVLLDAGVFREPEETQLARTVFQIRVQIPDGRKKTWTMNKTTRKRLSKKWGDDSEGWVNKCVKISITTQMVAGTIRDILWGTPTEEHPRIDIPEEQQQLATSKAEAEEEAKVSVVVNDILNAKSELTPKDINDLITEKQTELKSINLTQLQAVSLVATDLEVYKNGKLIA